jgi:hypothetical protein
MINRSANEAFVKGLMLGFLMGVLTLAFLLNVAGYTSPYGNYQRAWALYLEVKDREIKEYETSKRKLEAEQAKERARLHNEFIKGG